MESASQKESLMKLWRFFLFQICLTGCSQNQNLKVSFVKNEIGGLTKKIVNEKSGIYVDSIFDSFRHLKRLVEYFEPGHLKTIRQFKNGVQDSTMYIYYYNGNLKSKRFYFEGKPCFERIDFSENGKMTDYIFISTDTSNLYIRSYDTLLLCYNVRGTPFFESYMFSNPKSVFSTKDTVKTFFYAPAPPDCNVKLYTVYEDKDVENIKPLKEGFIYSVKIYPLSKGSFDWYVKMKIFDKKTDSLLYISELTKIEFKVQ